MIFANNVAVKAFVKDAIPNKVSFVGRVEDLSVPSTRPNPSAKTKLPF